MNHDGFERDVLGAPARLERLLGSDLTQRIGAVPVLRRVLFVGMGSSRFAAIPQAALLRSRGLDAITELASTDLPTLPARDLLVVAVSASGTTPETVEALGRHVGTSTTVAVTNDPDAPLGRGATHVLPLEAGVEEGGVSCLTYQATLATLRLLADHLLGEPPSLGRLRAAVDVRAALQDSRATWLPALVDLVAAGSGTYLIAPASRLSSALQGALMLREGPRLVADGTETGEWLHVDLYLTKRPGYAGLLFTGSPYDAEVMRWARDRKAMFVSVGQRLEGCAAHVELSGDPLVRLLVETAVPELVSAELWRRGVDAGDPALI